MLVNLARQRGWLLERGRGKLRNRRQVRSVILVAQQPAWQTGPNYHQSVCVAASRVARRLRHWFLLRCNSCRWRKAMIR